MAARRHWRFVVRDQYGFVIQNAKVNVYLPGTTTVFAGTAYDAASGGSAVTNPFTTNAFGEVEAWFDTAQVVDVQVDDNSNLAYRAVGGPSSTVDFSTFTEKDDIYVSASDGAAAVATTADMPDFTAALQAEAAGSSGRYSDGGHQHGHAAFSGNPHGPADHSDVTRSVWLPVSDGVVADGGVLVSHGTEPDSVRAIELADAASAGAQWTWMVPEDYTGAGINVEIYHAGAGTVAGSVRWELKALDLIEGANIVAAAGSVLFTGQAPTTADLLVVEASQAVALTLVAGELVRLSVRRLGADGADNYTATTRLIGIRLFYTSNQ